MLVELPFGRVTEEETCTEVCDSTFSTAVHGSGTLSQRAPCRGGLIRHLAFFFSPRISQVCRLSNPTPVGGQVIFRCGQIAIAGEGGRHGDL